ncbi:hypothetical protein FF2_009114 [Malus domestica]
MGAVSQVQGAAVATAPTMREAHAQLHQARRQEKAQPFQNPTQPALGVTRSPKLAHYQPALGEGQCMQPTWKPKLLWQRLPRPTPLQTQCPEALARETSS